MAPHTTTRTSRTSSTVIRGRPLSHSSERVIPSARFSTPTTSSTTTTTCSRRWVALTTISFHRHLGWVGRHMVSERHLGESATSKVLRHKKGGNLLNWNLKVLLIEKEIQLLNNFNIFGKVAHLPGFL